MAIQRVLTCVLAGLGGCTELPSRHFDIDVPTTIDLVAVVIQDAEGTRMTGLASRYLDHFDQVLPDAPDGAQVQVLGFRESTLIGQGLPRDADRRAALLRLAGPGDPTLPAPDAQWSGTLGGRTTTFEPASRDWSVTADWVGCPAVTASSSATVDLSCFGFWCDARVQQRDCELSYSMPECTAAGPLGATLERRGVASFAGHADFTSCVEQSGDGDRRTTCTGPGGALCALRVMAPPRPASLRVERVDVLDAPLMPPPMLRTSGGYLVGVVARGDRVFTVGAQGAYILRGSCPARPTEVIIVDVVRGSVVDVVPSAPCITDLVGDPLGDGFLALLGGPSPAVARFDGSGALIARLGLGRSAPTGLAAEIVVSERSQAVAVLFRSVISPIPGPVRVALIDLATLTSSRTVTSVLAGNTTTLAFRADGHLVLPEGSTVLQVVDPVTGVAAVGANIDDCTQSTVHGMRIDGPNAVFAVRSQQDALSTLDLALGESTCRRAVYPYRRAQPSAFGRLPWDEARWIVALDDDADMPGPWPTVLGVVDAERWAYLPEETVVGDGPWVDMVADGRGRLWAAEVWSGHLVQIGP